MIWPWTEIARLKRALRDQREQTQVAFLSADLWGTHARNLCRGNKELRRDLRQWERKYARLRLLLDPKGLHKEPPVGVRYESDQPGPGCVSLVELTAARMKELKDYAEAYGHGVK